MAVNLNCSVNVLFTFIFLCHLRPHIGSESKIFSTTIYIISTMVVVIPYVMNKYKIVVLISRYGSVKNQTYDLDILHY